MAGPTWPPGPEEADQETLAEYAEQASAVMAAESDEEAERLILARYLFAEPGRQLDGASVGTTLDEHLRALQGWLSMVCGRAVTLACSDPAATDGLEIYLPRALPAPARPVDDALLYRCMALVQLGLLHFGLLENRRLLADMHRDWVLRSTWHLLAARYVVRRWSDAWPGMARDLAAVPILVQASALRVNLTPVPARGMPGAFLPLYDGLVAIADVPGSEGQPALEATQAVDAISSHLSAPLVLAGQAQRLRQHFLRLRLGPPPMPWWLGILRPEWLLHDLAEELKDAEEWKKGPAPLRQLLDKIRDRGTPALLRKQRYEQRPPPPGQLAASGRAPRPADEDGRRYDEWDGQRTLLGFTTVRDVDAPSGPRDNYDRHVTANAGLIREVRRRFEALKVDERWLHGQSHGSELDLDRVVAAVGDLAAGQTPRPDWHERFVRRRDQLALLCAVDVSGSTLGDVIYREQEALVVLAEGLRVLDPPHALYAFSNQGPRDCRFARIKAFGDTYDEDVFKRLANLRAGGATRLGAFVRHATWLLGQRPEARRVLMLVSDGRPEDRGDYRGQRGLADTALALHAARAQGVHAFCVSLDRGAAEYLPRLFGARHLVLDRVEELPTRLPEVFAGLLR